MKMWFWIIWSAILIVVAGVQFSAASRSTTVYQTNASTYLTPQQIRQMPLLQRPNRPGHFYGNTVRRIHQRRMTGRYYGR